MPSPMLTRGSRRALVVAALASVPSLAPAAELYSYQALPSGSARPEALEIISMETERVGGRIVHTTRTTRRDEVEVTRIVMDTTGVLISAEREKTPGDGGVGSTARMLREGETIRVESSTRRRERARTKIVRDPDRFAVDASLLYLMRSFPFDGDTEWEIAMADFSQNFVTVSLKDEGTEIVSVPAGDFECHRMVVRVKLWFLRPRITFWIRTDPPHFLVKHEGKRGPFSRTYTTMLVGIGGR